MASTSAVTVNDLLPEDRVLSNLRLHRACEVGDVDGVKQLLASESVDTWYEDPSSANWSALHFACEADRPDIVRLLLRHGALWNAVDANGFTAAQVAWSYNHETCYTLIFEEGVRQTFLLNALRQHNEESDDEHVTLQASRDDVANDTDRYLRTKLRFEQDALGKTRCLDEDNNMVMAEWETDIMAHSAELICTNQPEGFAVLNVGFGLGIVDKLIQGYRPGRHVIIEAHADAIAYAKQLGFDKMPGVELFHGKWEDWISDADSDEAVAKMTQLGSFDAVYWDTYSQDYADIRRFFECLPTILNGPGSKFSFFNGLAATNQFFYDVYTRISELDLKEIGLDTSWTTLRPRIREEEWAGVKQKYWQLETYYCPLARMDVF